MSTAAVSSSSIYDQLQTYFQTRNSDLQQLGQSLASGDTAGAEQEFQAIQTLGQSGPFANGDAFHSSQRQQDFNEIGQALQSGDLADAQQAFAQLKTTVQPQYGNQPEPVVTINLGSSSAGSSSAASTTSNATSEPVTATSGSTQSANGPEIVLNLGNVTAGEQITIGLNGTANGQEQVTIGVSNEQGQTPEQISFNVNPNSNQEIVLNLFNSLTSTSGSTTQSSGVNVSA